MKFKLLNYLLVSSMMFSAHPFKVINSTRKNFIIDRLGVEKQGHDDISLGCEIILESGNDMNVEGNYNLMSVLSKERGEDRGDQIRNIKPNDVIVIIEYDGKLEFLRKGKELEIIPLYNRDTNNEYKWSSQVFIGTYLKKENT